MLKTLMIALPIALVGVASQASTLVNGSFEDIGNGTLSNSGWSILEEIPGWDGLPNIEVQSNPTLRGIDAQDGENYVELDTDVDSGITQDITLSVGTYRLSFFYSPRVDLNATTTNDMFYSVGNSFTDLLSGTVQGGPNLDYPWGQWTEVTGIFDVIETGDFTLSFFATGGSYQSGCGNCGALIDNVSLAAVPLPASVLFLLASILGLGIMRSRRDA
ncbi:MAG: VPLPA-CTERM sorting domain-containing protein [Roseobacter sp.]